MNKKVLKWSICLVVSMGIIWSVVKVNGNPFGKTIAKKEFNKYIDNNFSGTDYKINEIEYLDFEGEQRYIGKVRSKNEGIYFNLEYYKGNVISEKGDEPLIDFEIMSKFSKTLDLQLLGKLKKLEEAKDLDYKNVEKRIYVGFDNILQGKYKDRTVEFKSTMDDKFSINIDIIEEDVSDKEEFLNSLAMDVKEIVLEKNYNGFSNLSINIQKGNELTSLTLSKDELLKLNDYKDKIRWKG